MKTTKGMTITEAIALVKACKEASVSHFDGLGLRLTFEPTYNQDKSLERSAPLPAPPHPTAEESQNKRDELAVSLKQEQLEYLRLSDPLAYEELIIENELEPAGASNA